MWRKTWVKYICFAALAIVLLIGAVFVYALVRAVPPISAKVVDAISGKPIAGMNVCLQVDEGGFQHKILRREISRTGGGAMSAGQL